VNENNAINVNLDAPINRIFSKDKFLDLVKSRENGLVSPSKWDDPFENFFLNSRCVDDNGDEISLRSLAIDWYGQCWTYNDDTDAMWRIYSHSKNGIKVRTTARKLFQTFYDDTDLNASLKFFIGQVSYHPKAEFETFISNSSFLDMTLGGDGTGMFASLLCVKREAFSHEKEIRLLFHDIDPKRGAGGVARFAFDVNTVCDEVILDPRLSDEDAATLKTEIQTAGCSLTISQSDLYRPPTFTIRLT